jgi:hypothetical protein
MHRQRDARYRQKKGKKGIERGANGQQPGRLKELAASREKRSLALLAPWGITPKHAGVSPNAAREAQKGHARQSPCNEADSGFPTGRGQASSRPTTEQRALKQLLEAGQTRRLGQGGVAGALSVFPGIQIVPARPAGKDGRISAFIQRIDHGNGMLEASNRGLQADEGEAFIRSGDTGDASPSLVPTLFLADTAGHVRQHKFDGKVFP